MKSKIIYIALIALVLSSCSNFLDVKPSGKLVPTETEQLANLMNHASVYDWFFLDNNRGCSYGYLGDNISMSTTQHAAFLSSSPNMDRYAAYVYYEPIIDFNTNAYFFWNWDYRAINIYNTIIDGIADLNINDANAKATVSQAKAARAFNYLVSAVTFGPMWDPAGDNSHKIMPYRTAASPTIANPQLSDTDEMFAKIWEDLEAAVEYAPQLVGNPVWANKAAVHAMRAQYFMYKRDWDNMLREADDSWTAAGGDAGKLIYNFNDFRYREAGAPPTDGTSPEIPWSLEYAPGGAVNTAEPFLEARGRENLFWRRAVTSATNIYPSDDFLGLFDQANDLRYKLFALNNNGYKFGALDDGIQLNYLRANKLTRSHGITYPEVLLMRAEAYARTNKLSEALADLNTLRKNRYVGTDTDHPDGAELAANQDQLIEEILKERRREMPFYSYHRAVDIKRYFHDTGKPWSQATLTHMIGTDVYTKTLDKHSFTLPISNTTISYNPQWGLTPVEGYWDPFDR